jgi:hypothetical protein
MADAIKLPYHRLRSAAADALMKEAGAIKDASASGQTASRSVVIYAVRLA